MNEQNSILILADVLSDRQYHTAKELAGLLNVSEKTARTRIKELQTIGKRYGVTIESKARYGYLLTSEHSDFVERLRTEYEQEFLPDTSASRTQYLLVYLLNHADYTKIDDLTEFLCVSRSTLQHDLKEAEYTLQQYRLQIERRPNYGIRVVGEEFDLRRCISDCFIQNRMTDPEMSVYRQDELQQMIALVLKLLKQYQLYLQENVLETLVSQLYVGMKRLKHGFRIQFPDVSETEETVEYQFARDLSQTLEKWQNVYYDEAELRYITIYLKGNRRIGNIDSTASNFVIHESLNQLVDVMIESIYLEYGIDLSGNFHLRMSLKQHMVPFDIRMRYRIRIKNPILEEIKTNYTFGFHLAQKVSTVLADYYQCNIPEAEIGYLAMILVVSLEQREEEKRKSNILIVCGAGRGSSQLLKYKYEKEFRNSLDQVYVCGIYELDQFDFSLVDYVFTTVPVHTSVPVPIIEVGQFFMQKDILKVRQVLNGQPLDFLDRYYRPNHFLESVPGRTKEEVLQTICRTIRTQQVIPEIFYDSVMKREELAPTAFGNHAAMPHPHCILTEETFIYIAVLEHEIDWSGQPVQFVLLASISGAEDPHLPQFYEITTQFFMREDMIQTVIRERSFDVLMQMLRQLYYME